MSSTAPFEAWVGQVLGDARLAGMGHAQNPETADLGLGWIYYGMARLIKPSVAVVIGSYRGFVPMMIGRALADNGVGKVLFIDPGLVDGFWRDPAQTAAHFAAFGVTNVEHHCATTQQFVTSAAYKKLEETGMVFIDGFHSYEQAKFDFEAFEPLMPARGAILFHDSIRVRTSRIYGPDKAYEHRVRDLMLELRSDPRFHLFDLPFGDGVTLLRKSAADGVLFP